MISSLLKRCQSAGASGGRPRLLAVPLWDEQLAGHEEQAGPVAAQPEGRAPGNARRDRQHHAHDGAVSSAQSTPQAKQRMIFLK